MTRRIAVEYKYVDLERGGFGGGEKLYNAPSREIVKNGKL